MSKKRFLGIILFGLTVVLVVGFVYIIFKNQPFSSSNSSQVVLTSQLSGYGERLVQCEAIPSNSIQKVSESRRLFINLPKDLYPQKISSFFTTVSGDATAGYISNAGLPGEAEGAKPGCWSTYYGFNGNGEVSLRVKSIKEGVPDYFVRFLVGLDILPSDCKIVRSSSQPNERNEWLIDCGSRNDDARGRMGLYLEKLGWKSCASGLGTGKWWKDGIVTGVAESAGASYPFSVTQQSGIDCSSQ